MQESLREALLPLEEHRPSPLMFNFPTTVKLLGAAALVGGGITALSYGASRVSDFMMAAGCLMVLAVKIVEWWDRR
jgi:curli biogenesis system outer membrane secretion channel CsgG